MSLNINHKIYEKHIVFFLEGEIDLSSSHNFKEYVEKEIKNNQFDIEIDFEKVDFIDSTGLGTLVNLYKNISEYRDLCVCNLQDHVKKVFTITGLDKQFICKGATDAE